MVKKTRKYVNPFLKEKVTLAPSENPSFPKIHEAIALHEKGNFAQAELLYKEVLKLEPKNTDALHLLGLIAYQCGSHVDALNLISQAIELNPNDPIYLSDMARAVRSMNEAGNSLGILFRRCPVDFSTRYDAVLQEFQDCIVSVAPKWKKQGADWNTILPTKADMQLLVNTIYHTQLVVNLGSSMVFDYAALHKPCAYIRYDVPNCPVNDWSVQKIYNFIFLMNINVDFHFSILKRKQ
jgi:tetratricopeptide (TPR) repeat protein